MKKNVFLLALLAADRFKFDLMKNDDLNWLRYGRFLQ